MMHLPLLVLLALPHRWPVPTCTVVIDDKPEHVAYLVAPHDDGDGHELLGVNFLISMREHERGTMTLHWACELHGPR